MKEPHPHRWKPEARGDNCRSGVQSSDSCPPPPLHGRSCTESTPTTFWPRHLRDCEASEGGNLLLGDILRAPRLPQGRIGALPRQPQLSLRAPGEQGGALSSHRLGNVDVDGLTSEEELRLREGRLLGQDHTAPAEPARQRPGPCPALECPPPILCPSQGLFQLATGASGWHPSPGTG